MRNRIAERHFNYELEGLASGGGRPPPSGEPAWPALLLLGHYLEVACSTATDDIVIELSVQTRRLMNHLQYFSEVGQPLGQGVVPYRYPKSLLFGRRYFNSFSGTDTATTGLSPCALRLGCSIRYRDKEAQLALLHVCQMLFISHALAEGDTSDVAPTCPRQRNYVVAFPALASTGPQRSATQNRSATSVHGIKEVIVPCQDGVR